MEDIARKLRRNSTDAELKLWYYFATGIFQASSFAGSIQCRPRWWISSVSMKN